MPSPGSIVLLTDGRIGEVTHVSPLGDNDLVLLYGPLGGEAKVTAYDIAEVYWDYEDSASLPPP